MKNPKLEITIGLILSAIFLIGTLLTMPPSKNTEETREQTQTINQKEETREQKISQTQKEIITQENKLNYQLATSTKNRFYCNKIYENEELKQKCLEKTPITEAIEPPTTITQEEIYETAITNKIIELCYTIENENKQEECITQIQENKTEEILNLQTLEQEIYETATTNKIPDLCELIKNEKLKQKCLEATK